MLNSSSDSATFAFAGVTTFRQPCHKANGNTYDRQGRLLTCEHDTRRVTRDGGDSNTTVYFCCGYTDGGTNSTSR